MEPYHSMGVKDFAWTSVVYLARGTPALVPLMFYVQFVSLISCMFSGYWSTPHLDLLLNGKETGQVAAHSAISKLLSTATGSCPTL